MLFYRIILYKTLILRSSILWCWAIPWVLELSSASYRSILCHRLILKLKIENLHMWGHAQIDGKFLKSLKKSLELSKCGSEDRSKISNFSDVHRSQLFWPAQYPCPCLIIVHSILNSNPRSLKDQIFSDSLVLFRYRSRRNDDLCLLYRSLNVPSVIPM